MLITKYTISNFGLFKGKHTFDLRTSSAPGHERPIVIIGGKNGSGKTTLFEGIKLCVYGANFRGHPLSNNEYEGYLESRLHRSAGLSTSEGAYVSIELEHSHLGEISKYLITRSWIANPINERLEVLQDGRPVDDIATGQLQDFLKELIPIGLSKLFFFDGEQIQHLAEDERDNRHLKDSFNSLLGLDLVNQLQTDLRIHFARKLREDISPLEQEFSRLSKESESLATQLEQLTQQRARKQTEIDSVNSEIERKEHQLASEGGFFADKREELRTRGTELQSKISMWEDRIRELASSLLPFAVVPDLCVSLKQRLLLEERCRQQVAAKDLFSKALGELRATAAGMSSSIIEPIHEVSESEYRALSNWIDQSSTCLPSDLKTATVELESCLRELRNVEESLSRVPAEENVAPFVQQINRLHEELGSLTKEMRDIEERIDQANLKLKENERQLAKRAEEQRQIQLAKERMALSSKVQKVLSEFSTRLRKQKLKDVSERFVTAFNELSTKKNRVDRIAIGEDDFSITLFRKNGTAISKYELSTGEKQVYAIAMLTALAQVSGRPIPFMIDAPLARLDLEHRSNLASSFFPKVSHQVIIFSTDTEIDRMCFEQLAQFVSKAYLLSYSRDESSTVSEGYFWRANLG